MKALRKNDGFYFELADSVYDRNGKEYHWKDLVLVADEGEDIVTGHSTVDKNKLRQQYSGMFLQVLCKKYKHVNAYDSSMVTVVKEAIKLADILIEELEK